MVQSRAWEQWKNRVPTSTSFSDHAAVMGAECGSLTCSQTGQSRRILAISPKTLLNKYRTRVWRFRGEERARSELFYADDHAAAVADNSGQLLTPPKHRLMPEEEPLQTSVLPTLNCLRRRRSCAYPSLQDTGKEKKSSQVGFARFGQGWWRRRRPCLS